jgi:hypothetical protein
MNAIEFVQAYPNILSAISMVCDPRFAAVVEELEAVDPHDLITPAAYFTGTDHAYGFVFCLFFNRAIAWEAVQAAAFKEELK